MLARDSSWICCPWPHCRAPTTITDKKRFGKVGDWGRRSRLSASERLMRCDLYSLWGVAALCRSEIRTEETIARAGGFVGLLG